MKLSDGEPIFFWREALGLMLKGEFEIPSEKLLSLLCFGSYTISRKDFDEYYSREYSLFEYITERVDSVTLAPKVIENYGQILTMQNTLCCIHSRIYHRKPNRGGV